MLTLKALKKEFRKETSAIKEITGSVVIKDGNTYGFIDNAFVSPDLVKSKGLSNGDQINATAMLSFNKKKKEWGWKCIEIY